MRPDERVQFFTDQNGVVHPIRASYQNERRSPFVNTGRAVDYGDDEDF